MNPKKELLYDPMFLFKAAQLRRLSGLPLFLLCVQVLYQQNSYNGLSDWRDDGQNNIVPFENMNGLGTQLQKATVEVTTEQKQHPATLPNSKITNRGGVEVVEAKKGMMGGGATPTSKETTSTYK